MRNTRAQTRPSFLCRLKQLSAFADKLEGSLDLVFALHRCRQTPGQQPERHRREFQCERSISPALAHANIPFRNRFRKVGKGQHDFPMQGVTLSVRWLALLQQQPWWTLSVCLMVVV